MMSVDLIKQNSSELAELLRTIPVSEWNMAVEAARVKQVSWIADLSNADLLDADLLDADLRNANLRNANLSNANLSDANLRNANLSYADLRDADLRSADLSYADLRDANLSNANLRDANLSYADLSYADLRDADLRSADLYYANLRSANLSYADLRDANLRSADLSYANLRNAHNDGTPLTIDQWCDIFHMPTVGKGLRVGFKRLPNDRITGRNQNNGKYLVEWKPNRWVETPDWNDNDECGGGLHISPTAAMTSDYSSEPLLIVVAFDPKDAVCLGDKLKVRKCKVIG